MKQILKLSVRNIFRHPVKNILIGIVIFLACFLAFYTASLADQSEKKWRTYYSETFLGTYHVTGYKGMHKDYTFVPMNHPKQMIKELIPEYLEKRDVEFTRRMKIGAAIFDNEMGEFKDTLATVIATDLKKEMKLHTNLTVVEGKYDETKPDGILVWYELAKKFKWTVGDIITLYIKDVDGDSYPYDFEITGILNQKKGADLEGKGVILMFPIIFAQKAYVNKILGFGKKTGEIAVWDPSEIHKDQIQQLATRQGYQFFESEKGFGILYGIVDFINFLGVFGEFFILIILVVASLNINMIGFFERRQELGAMIAMGAKPGWLAKLLITEMLVFVFFVFLIAVGAYALFTVAASGGIDYGESAVMFAGDLFRPGIIAMSLLAGFVIVSLAMILSLLYPMYLALKIDPVDVFREKNL